MHVGSALEVQAKPTNRPVNSGIGQVLREPNIRGQLPTSASKVSPDDDSSSSWLKNIVDSSIRALGRQAESSFGIIADNAFVRIPFRFVTETVRNGTSGTVQRVLENKKVTATTWIGGAKKAVENATASAMFEPNRFKNSLARVGIGLLNMIIRLVSRIVLIAFDVLDPSSIDLQEVPDELFSRSLGRIIRPFTANPFIQLGTRFGEQVAINFGLDKLLVKNHLLPRLLNGTKKQNQANPTPQKALQAA